MGKVIQFPQKEKFSEEAVQMKDVSDQLDAVILDALYEGMDPYEVAGLLSHRLGSLMHSMEDRARLWKVLERVLKRQADIV